MIYNQKFGQSFQNGVTAMEQTSTIPVVVAELVANNLGNITMSASGPDAKARPENDYIDNSSGFFRTIYESFRPENVSEGYKIIGQKTSEIAGAAGRALEHAVFAPLLIGGMIAAYFIFRK